MKQKNKTKKRETMHWAIEDMCFAMGEVELGTLTLRAATRKYGMHPSSLAGWLDGCISTRRQGPDLVLNKAEEEKITEWVYEHSKAA